jgi:hypothetical protein
VSGLLDFVAPAHAQVDVVVPRGGGSDRPVVEVGGSEDRKVEDLVARAKDVEDPRVLALGVAQSVVDGAGDVAGKGETGRNRSAAAVWDC